VRTSVLEATLLVMIYPLLVALLAALFYAVCFLISAALCRRQDAATVTFWTLVGAALGVLPVALLQDRILPQEASGWLNLAAQALIVFASQILIARTLRTLDAGVSAIAGYGQPVVPQTATLIGSVFIVAGIALAGRGEAEVPATPGAVEPAPGR
jgi:drug/metabolite transporter (DMT)-like permease